MSTSGLARLHASTTRAYMPYGAVSSVSRSALAFCGERQDGPHALYHLGNGHRAYSPRLMRFLSSDRLSPFSAGGCNAYAYCLNDPINHRDPSGQTVEDRVLPALSILTNLLGLFVSGLRFRAFYKQLKTVDRNPVVGPAAAIVLPERQDWVLSSVSALTAMAGMTIGIARTVEPENEWQTWVLAGLTMVSLGTTGVEAWRMAKRTPWKPSEVDLINLRRLPRGSSGLVTSNLYPIPPPSPQANSAMIRSA